MQIRVAGPRFVVAVVNLGKDKAFPSKKQLERFWR
jgi:hypothetical protein